jgi:hypothetical protein
MLEEKFIDLPRNRQGEVVRNRFVHREGCGWFTREGIFAGVTEEDVIAALIDLEAAEIDAIGDCMGGCSMLAPQLEDFVRKP